MKRRVLTLVAAPGCGIYERVYLKHPVNGRIVQCGPYKSSRDDASDHLQAEIATRRARELAVTLSQWL